MKQFIKRLFCKHEMIVKIARYGEWRQIACSKCDWTYVDPAVICDHSNVKLMKKIKDNKWDTIDNDDFYYKEVI